MRLVGYIVFRAGAPSGSAVLDTKCLSSVVRVRSKMGRIQETYKEGGKLDQALRRPQTRTSCIRT